ncbi:MAG TPA: sulfite exporter TauE/SafE family protein [Anaerolineae bacterium]|nr:sulfite exporter TauE/SafE family protein [Anaerolineae bacterium]HIQ06100.1 sulfite exporter TauE/SafE family protein [Anaerolineae bacterium]
MWIILALTGVGITAGILGALMGLGGGIFLVPALTLLFHQPIRVAVGTSLVGVIATSAGVAAMARLGRGADVALALRLELITTLGAIAGSVLAGRLDSQSLSLLFTLVVFLTAAYTGYKARRQLAVPGKPAIEALFRTDYTPHHWPAGLGIASIAGALSGLVGVGGGFVKVPVMYAVMGVPLGVATATSNFMVGITAAASVFVYYGRGDIHPLVTVPTAMGVFLGAVGGARLAPRLRVSWLRQALVWLLVLIGIQMLLKGLGIYVP